ncbi:MAG: hypothetical protein ACREHD_27010, partial [Pirellulales bacterium]
LLNADESVLAIIELNGYALVGKRDGELLRAIGETALQTSLSTLPRREGKSSVRMKLLYFGSVAPETRQAASQDLKPIEEACRAIASNTNLDVSRPSQVYYNGVEQGWQRLVTARSAADLTQEAADESAEGDAQVIAFPVRTKATRMLISEFSSDDVFLNAPDCVVYVLKPLDADDDPLIDTVLWPRIEHAVSKLRLVDKNIIAFHFVLAEKDRESWKRSRDAVSKRVVGPDGEAGRLAKSLGFKASWVTY